MATDMTTNTESATAVDEAPSIQLAELREKHEQITELFYRLDDNQTGEIRRNIAMRLDKWRNRNRYYHERISEYLRFVIPPGESVLLLGCEDGQLLEELQPARGVGIDQCPQMTDMAAAARPQYDYIAAEDWQFKLDESFEYIVINDVAGDVRDLFELLKNLRRLCTPTTRLIVVQHNYLWRPILNAAAALHLKRPETRQSWLSAGDLQVFLQGVGFETVDVRGKLFCPKKLFGLGTIINFFAGALPCVHRLASTEILVNRPITVNQRPETQTASIVLTTRDERDNIEPMVRAIPQVGAETEIIFVEGHSTDGTREEITRVIDAYPDKKIRLIVQDGHGQGDAIRKGFAEAHGDVIILLEADQTSPPEDVLKAFEVIAAGRADYINGSRFIYPREPGSMPRLNVAGNWLFAAWFSWFLKQRTSDVLCGIKAIDRRWYRRLLKGWGFLGLHDPFGDFELIFGAARLGAKICEVPTRYACRQYGQTKSRVFKHGWMLARMAWRATRVFKCR
jgi:SAM-dependent methyltransferase